MAEQRKTPAKEEDRISALPDRVIQHILSLLPSTNEAIRTTVLSKRWNNQWTRVSNLIFDPTGMSDEKFSRFIDKTLLLHDCSKINKFHIQKAKRRPRYDDMAEDLTFDIDLIINWDVKFHFAIKKDVEDLLFDIDLKDDLMVPRYVFEHPSYVKLHMYGCDFSSIPNRSVSWPNLKKLTLLGGLLPDQAIENILSGSPSLESFEFEPPNPATYHYDIVSKSLKKLKLLDYDLFSSLQISCPNLEELDIGGLFIDSATLRLTDSPSLIRATLDFYYYNKTGNYDYINNDILQFKHVKELIFGMFFTIKTLSVLKSSGTDLSRLLLNNKSLTIYCYDIKEHYAGIECALRLSHVIEKLVIWLTAFTVQHQRTRDLPDLNVSRENHWNSIGTTFNCLVSHLKFVEIYGLTESDEQYEFVIDFIEFLLNNARVLEKLVVILKDSGNDFVIQVSQKLLSFPRCSQNALVEVLYSN